MSFEPIMLLSSIIRASKFLRLYFSSDFISSLRSNCGCFTLTLSSLWIVHPWTLYAAHPVGAATLTESLHWVNFRKMVMIVLIMNDLPVPPHPKIVALKGLYVSSFRKNLIIASTAPNTIGFCSSVRSSYLYSLPNLFLGSDIG